MILNTQMSGEAMWFWYGDAMQHGARFYSDLHSPLQPLFALFTEAWMSLFGHRLLVTQLPGLFWILGHCVGIYLILRESDLPDWQKACIFLATFTITVFGHSYRFDDYHVVAEMLLLYSLLLLLWVYRTEDHTRLLWMAVGLGVLSGLEITSRLTDGAGLLVSDLIILPLLLRSRRMVTVAVYLATAMLTLVLVVSLTGDSMKVWLFTSVIRAAGSKGGTSSILAAPLRGWWNAWPEFWKRSKQFMAVMIALTAIGPLVCRFWKPAIRYIFGLQVAAAAIIFLLLKHSKRHDVVTGMPVISTVLLLTCVVYLLVPFVLGRFMASWLQRNRPGHRPWDAREALVVMLLANAASYGAAAAGEPLTNYYVAFALFLLLIAVLHPFRHWAVWANPSYALYSLVLALSAITAKVITPYSWQHYEYPMMFTQRQVYHHPVYGVMYIDRDLLNFSRAVCEDIGATPEHHPEMLSLPYPYPNYFCDTPPWHNYVQTWFDISTRATIEQLMRELDSAPPQYIVYQRQLDIMGGAEHLYNHDQPLPQRGLDKLIMRKLNSGEWKLIDLRGYLEGGGWWIIQTHP